MEFSSLPDLTTPDDRSLRFTPRGLSLGGTMKPAFAAEYIQRTVAVPIAEAVPESTRRSFDRLRSIHVYGMFNYELFTAAYETAPFILEQALGERFVRYYGGRVPLVDSAGAERPIEAQGFHQVNRAFRRGGTHQTGKWRVRSNARPGTTLPFRGTLMQLFAWARHEGLLNGQGSRYFDRAMVDLRNSVAHRSSYQLTTPVESARLIWETGEIINRVWNERTSGGRIFPLPAERHVFAIGWSPQGTTAVRCWADQLAAHDDAPDWRYIIVRAVEADEEIFSFDSGFALTRFPTDLLWGPGAKDEAIRWLARTKPAGDHVDYLDRLFLVRLYDGVVEAPRVPTQFLRVRPELQSGAWYMIQADFPINAFTHARGLALGQGDCSAAGPCMSCWATTVVTGDWGMLASRFSGARGPEEPAHVAVPRLMGSWH